MTDLKIVWEQFTSKQLGKRDGFNLLMHGFVQDEAETVAMYNALLTDIMNNENNGHGIKRTTAITRSMILGIEIYKDYLEQKGALSQEAKDAIEAFNFQVEDIIHEKNQKYVKRLYERGNIEKAQDYAKRHNLDYDKIVQSYTLPIGKQEKSPHIREWLSDYFSDSKEVTVSRVKADIIEDGIIDPGEWSLVKSIASTDGYSGGKRGYWTKS